MANTKAEREKEFIEEKHKEYKAEEDSNSIEEKPEKVK